MKKCIVRNEKLQHVFDLVSNEFESIGPNYFTYFGQQLVKRSNISEGNKVLDVACGRGASLITATELIGPYGKSIGIDFSKEMIRNLQNYIDVESVKNMSAVQMDAENVRFDNEAFDNVYCGLSLHFFTDPIQSIEEMFRVLKQGGSISISTWGIKKIIGKKSVYQRAYERVFYDDIDSGRKKEEVLNEFDYSSKSGLEKILMKSGFEFVEVQVETKTFYYESKEEWWQEQNNNATRGFFERIIENNPIKFHLFKKAVLEEVEKDVIDGRIAFEATVLYGFGVKAINN